MRLKLIMTGFLMCSSIQCITAMPLSQADDIETMSLADNPSTSDDWTLERMKNAKPYPMPLIDQSINEALQHNDISQKPTISKDGMLPEQENSKVSNGVTYTFGPYYSSSRLIPNTANVVYPYSTVGKLFFTIPQQGDFFCSASVINYRIVLTAGHCVHDGSNSKNGFYTNFSFVPAYRNGDAPFLAWRGNYVAVTKAWFQSGGVLPNGADYAMIEVKDRSSGTPRRLGSDTGFLGYQINSLRFNHATILGYPKNIDHGEQMHQVTSEHAGAVLHHVVLYGSDMREGSDGGPFVQNFGKASIGQTGGQNAAPNKVIGVSSYFYNPNFQIEASSILDDRFVNLLNKLCAHKVGNCD